MNSPLPLCGPSASGSFVVQRRKHQSSGFSLVEVVLAIGVVAFAFVALFGLLPTGLQTFRKAMDVSIGAQIFQKVIDDAQQTSYSTLVDDTDTQVIENPASSAVFQAPLMGKGNLRYFDESGSEVVPVSISNPQGGSTGATLNAQEQQQVVYYVNTRIAAPTTLPVNSSAETVATNPFLASVTVQVASNPGNVSLPIDPTTFLYATPLPRGVIVTTYSGLVGYSN